MLLILNKYIKTYTELKSKRIKEERKGRREKERGREERKEKERIKEKYYFIIIFSS